MSTRWVLGHCTRCPYEHTPGFSSPHWARTQAGPQDIPPGTPLRAPPALKHPTGHPATLGPHLCARRTRGPARARRARTRRRSTCRRRAGGCSGGRRGAAAARGRRAGRARRGAAAAGARRAPGCGTARR